MYMLLNVAQFSSAPISCCAYLARLLGCYVAHKSFATLDCPDWVQVNTNDQAAHWHVLDSYLKPSSYTLYAILLKLLVAKLVQNMDAQRE